MPRRALGWLVALLMGCSLTGPVQAKSLDQQVFQLPLVMDQIRRSCKNAFGVNHAGLQDAVLLGFDGC